MAVDPSTRTPRTPNTASTRTRRKATTRCTWLETTYPTTTSIAWTTTQATGTWPRRRPSARRRWHRHPTTSRTRSRRRTVATLVTDIASSTTRMITTGCSSCRYCQSCEGYPRTRSSRSGCRCSRASLKPWKARPQSIIDYLPQKTLWNARDGSHLCVCVPERLKVIYTFGTRISIKLFVFIFICTELIFL